MASDPRDLSIAWFITPHGFGHAARAAAVIEALHTRLPGARFSLFTSVPEWFFEKSLSAPFGYHPLEVDVGLVQKTPLTADYDLTRTRLTQLALFFPERIGPLARQLNAMNCSMVVCDIAALGIAAAKAAGISSVLIENFTWDWIYAGIDELAGTIPHLIDELHRIYAAADYRIQTEPLCARVAADLVVGPISRRPRQSRAETRQKLAISGDTKLVLVTMGGIAQDYRFLDGIGVPQNIHLIISGGGQQGPNNDRITWLPFNSEHYHPDLVHACDAVVGKAGYSTLAEAYNAGVAFGYIIRSGFKETDILAEFIDSKMGGLRMSTDDFFHGKWMGQLDRLMDVARTPQPDANGSERVAEFLAGLIATGSRKA